jgi:hypothetical protein
MLTPGGSAGSVSARRVSVYTDERGTSQAADVSPHRAMQSGTSSSCRGLSRRAITRRPASDN